MNTNKIVFRNAKALVFGAFLAVLPISATTISFTTTGTPSTDLGASGADFTFSGASVSSFDPTAGVFFSGATTSTSFGYFSLASGTPTSNVVDVKLAPTVNGGAAAVVDFKGTISAITGTTAYQVNFSGTPGATNITTGTFAGYTQLVSNGVTYDVKTAEQMNTGTIGKQTWLAGYIQGVPGGTVPEPATVATTGLALAVVGFAVRRKAKANS